MIRLPERGVDDDKLPGWFMATHCGLAAPSCSTLARVPSFEFAWPASLTGIEEIWVDASVGQAKSKQLAGIIAAADCENDILFAVEHVSHRRAALWRGHVDSAHLVSSRFIVGAQHCAALS